MSGGRGPQQVRTILVPIDESASSHRALALACGMAAAFGAKLTLLRVVPLRELPVLMHEANEPIGVESAEVSLAEPARLAQSMGVAPKVLLKRGRAADQILRCVTAIKPDLVVMGSRGLSAAKGVLLGSVSQAVSWRAKASVLLVR
jgi:nucleotide-binding universal stress UspA family protein